MQILRFVVNKVLEPTNSLDPYNDDFYYLQVKYLTVDNKMIFL